MNHIWSLFRFSFAGLRVLLALTVLLGVVYPLAVTGIAQVAAPWRANGSLLDSAGEQVQSPDEAVASELIGQSIDSAGLFVTRPSAAGDGYDTLGTYGSNYGPESPDLIAEIEARQAEIAEREGVEEADVPPDAVTASGSGLDPHISAAYADLQVPRVASASGLSEEQVRAEVAEHTDGRTLGVLGEPRVNAITLNLALLGLSGDAQSSDQGSTDGDDADSSDR